MRHMGPVHSPGHRLQRVCGSEGVERLLPSSLSNYIGRVVRAYRVLPWERDFLDRFEASDCDAAISVPRGAGKTRIAASVAAAVIDPRSAMHGGEVDLPSPRAFAQARLVFEDVLELLGPVLERDGTGKYGDWRVQDSIKTSEIVHRPSKARLRCLGADPAAFHGLRPRLVIGDELAQWAESKIDRALAALKTGLGKVPHSRMLSYRHSAIDRGSSFRADSRGPGDPHHHSRRWTRR